MAVQGRRAIQFHVVVEGECIAVVRGRRIPLAAGDVFVLAREQSHVVCSDARLAPSPPPPPLPSEDGLPCVRLPGAAETILLCGILACDEPVFDPLIGALPSVIVDRAARDARTGWFAAMLRYLASCGEAGAAGWSAVQTRLVEAMFVDVVRRHVRGLAPGQANWLVAMRDPHVGRSLAELHAAPGQAWTVAKLARRVGMSRSQLAERFTAIAGVSPIRYLASWRIQLAASLLRGTQLSIAEAASRVGYRSEAAFHRAFKRLVGESPAVWRARASGADRS